MLLGRTPSGCVRFYYFRGRGFTIFASEYKRDTCRSVGWTPAERRSGRPVGSSPRGLRSNRERRSSAMSWSVPPSHVVSITRDGASIRRYWDFDTDAQIRLRDFGEYAEAFRERFEAAVTRRMRSAHPVAISLSGGLDSSSIASFAALARDRNGGTPEILAVSSFGPEGSVSDERSFARSVADRWSMDLVLREIVPGGLVGHGSDIAWAVECPVGTPVPNMVVDLLAASREHRARLMLTGHWGDQFVSDQTYYVDLARCFRWITLARRMFERRRWALDEDQMVYAGRSFEASRSASSLPRCVPPLRRFRTTASRPVRARLGSATHSAAGSSVRQPSKPRLVDASAHIMQERSTSRRDPPTRS